MPTGKSVFGFLSKKMWHPTNGRNKKRKWLAEQEDANVKKRLKEARAELKKESNKMEALRMAAKSGDNEAAKEMRAAQMAFMYRAPPGMNQEASAEENQDEDEAVRAFNEAIRNRTKKKKDNFSGVKLTMSNLEKQAGLRQRKRGVTLEEQIERFPELKNAPLKGDYAKDIAVTFQPFGEQIRHVKCRRCGKWGHRTGDRECEERDRKTLSGERRQRERQRQRERLPSGEPDVGLDPRILGSSSERT